MKFVIYSAIASAVGVPLGYYIGLLLDAADALFDAYMDGIDMWALHWSAEVR